MNNTGAAGTETLHYATPTSVPISLGPIMVHPNGGKRPLTPMQAQHETNHQTQSLVLGPLYLPVMLTGYVVGAVPGTVQYLYNQVTGSDDKRKWWQVVPDWNPLEILAGPER